MDIDMVNTSGSSQQNLQLSPGSHTHTSHLHNTCDFEWNTFLLN